MNSIPRFDKLPRVARRLVWITLTLVLGSGVVLALTLQFLREQAHQAAQKSTESLARIVQEQTDRTLEGVDLRLQLAAAQLAQLRTSSALNVPTAEAMLLTHVKQMPFVQAMWVMDAKGIVLYDSNSRYAGADLADRAYFQIHLKKPETGFYLGTPVKSRFDNDWIIGATRSLRSADGAFDGVVVASLDLHYFDKLWSTLNLGGNGSLSLFSRDAILLLRSPVAEDAIGKHFPNLTIFNLLTSGKPEGSFENASRLDNVVRDFAYRTLIHYPAIVVAGRAHETTFLPWMRMATISVVVWASASLCVLLLLAALVRDLLRREAMEQTLRESKTKQRAMLDALPDLMFELGADGRYHDYHSPRSELLLTGPDNFLGKNLNDVLQPETAAKVMATVQEALANGHSNGAQISLDLPQGTHWFELSAARKEPLAGEGPRCIVLSRDITQRKNDELNLQKGLNEKVGLLNEVHHRVKNNLQVIASLLRLEANRSVQVETKTVLGEMQGRIRSMALLHESLYRTGTFASVELGAYLKQLCLQAFRSGAQMPEAVRLVMDMAVAPVTLDQATPCGLLVNELVSNCLKHAFPDGRTGEVRVALTSMEDRRWCLSVSDNGVGLPVDFDARRSASLGLQLVSDLTRQLESTLEVGPSPGATFKIIFKSEIRSYPYEN